MVRGRDTGLPSGTLTFLLTDIEGSTRLWEEHPDEMSASLARHDAVIAEEVERAGGILVRAKGEGDSCFAVFDRAIAGVGAALASQRRLSSEAWSISTPLHVRVRMALHTGDAELRDNDYYGVEVNRCARLRAVMYGGQTLLSGATAALVRHTLPAGASLLDLGTHRLKDLSAPERIFQLVHPDLPDDFPPLLSLDSRPHNLPVELTSFVGREREVDDVGALVMSSRLVTLLGPGGSGKTRLALRVAAGLIEQVPDGAWLVQLAPVSDPELVAQTVVNELRLPEDPARTVLETLLARLRDREMVIVLDNCEQVVGAVCTLATDILRSCADVRIVATSRERLNAPGEATYHVQPVELGDAVELFAERARLVKHDFEVGSENAGTVEEICRRVDRLPLSIELAASRVGALSLRDILERLTHRFRLLRGTDRARIGRHESLGAAIDWSYSLLDEIEQAAFRRLAVFVGGFGVEAAEAVCACADIDPSDVLDKVSRLVDKSMVVAGEGGDGKVRYRLLETMRAYAMDRLAEAGEDHATRASHLGYYLSLGEVMNVGFDGPDQADWLDLAQEEIDNFRAALAHADATDDEALVKLAGALGPFWYRRGLLEGHSWFSRSLNRDAPARPRLRAAIWGVRSAVYTGDLGAAVRRSDLALRLARENGEDKWIVRALTEAAQVRMGTDEASLASRHSDEAVEIARRSGDPGVLWEALHRASTVELRQGDTEKARALALEAVEQARRPGGDPMQLELALYDAAWAAVATGRLEQVPALAEETFALAVRHGDEAGIGMSLNVSAIAAAASDDAFRALRLAGAGARAWSRMFAMPGPEERAMLDEWLGRARRAIGSEDADRAWQQGWDLPREVAIAYALGDESAMGPAAARGMLTAREMEVAELVAEGHSNREIAARLVLSDRTVDAHLDHIRNKLGMRKRVKIAAWVADQRVR